MELTVTLNIKLHTKHTNMGKVIISGSLLLVTMNSCVASLGSVELVVNCVCVKT